MDHPVDLQQLPEAARKALGGAAPLRLMLARGMAPLPPAALVSALYALCYERADEKLREAAQKTFGALPDAVLQGALGADLHAAVLDELATRLPMTSAMLERVVRHANVAVETVVRLARKGSEALSEVIAINEQRLIANPEVIEALYMNERTRMSTADRVVELAARHGLTVNIPGFDGIVAALKGQKPPPPPESVEAKTADANFTTALAETEKLTVDAVLEEDEAGESKQSATTEKAEKSIAEMSITEKIRTAMLGTAAARGILVRSYNKLVSKAVLDSPKLTDDEIIKYSASRQVSEDTLRRIANSKTFTRLYDVKFNLVNNPKCPLTESMKYLSHLRESDVRKLMGNKNVPAGLRNAANGMLAQKKKK